MGYVISILPLMLIGLVTSLEMYFCSLILVLPLSILFGVWKVTAPKPVRWLLNVYTWAWRGTPLLLQLMIAVYGLPMLGINIPKFIIAAGVFCLNITAYVTEIMRAAINSVDKGQYEACQVLGMSHFRAMIRVILPQSIRIALPPTCSAMINLIKDTALVTVISLMDLTRTAVIIANRDFNIIPYVIAFIMFIFLTYFLIRLFGSLEKIATAYD
jgi:polar amino acid transport system permease protein